MGNEIEFSLLHFKEKKEESSVDRSTLTNETIASVNNFY